MPDTHSSLIMIKKLRVIELRQNIDTSRILSWITKEIKPKLVPDVSNYAKGRMRAWLRIEPPLSPTQGHKSGIEVSDAIWDRLQEIINAEPSVDRWNMNFWRKKVKSNECSNNMPPLF